LEEGAFIRYQQHRSLPFAREQSVHEISKPAARGK
jgi:hypothetical protein